MGRQKKIKSKTTDEYYTIPNARERNDNLTLRDLERRLLLNTPSFRIINGRLHREITHSGMPGWMPREYREILDSEVLPLMFNLFGIEDTIAPLNHGIGWADDDSK